MNVSRNRAAAIPDRRWRPPERMLIIDWPIIAHPPIEPNRPQTMFAKPWATHSRLLEPRVSVNSSMSVSVISDSISPIEASVTARPPITSEALERERDLRDREAARDRPVMWRLRRLAIGARRDLFAAGVDASRRRGAGFSDSNSSVFAAFSAERAFISSTESLTVTASIGVRFTSSVTDDESRPGCRAPPW